MKFLFLLAGLLFGCAAHAQTLMRVDQPLYYMTATTPALAHSKRVELIEAIWGDEAPVLQVPTIFLGNANGGELATSYFGRAPSTGIWLAFYMEKGVVARTYYATFPGSDCLAIVNGGHGEGFFNVNNVPGFMYPSVDALVRRLAAKPCDIILNSMPLQGENRFAAAYLNITPEAADTHDKLALLLPAIGSPLKYFMTPPLASLNYALSQRSYSKVVALGLSGGGWATSMIAAIDPRIQRAYAVAGSVPLAFRGFLPEGDWEQYHLSIDYLDIYAMAVAEAGRKNFLFYNGKDSCCFQAGGVFPWVRRLSKVLSAFPGEFEVYMLYGSPVHEMRPEFADFIMNDLAQ
jgi:hypothetical protein